MGDFCTNSLEYERSDLSLLRFLLLVGFRGILLFRVLCGRVFALEYEKPSLVAKYTMNNFFQLVVHAWRWFLNLKTSNLFRFILAPLGSMPK